MCKIVPTQAKFFVCVLLLLVGVPSGPAFAQTDNWTGANMVDGVRYYNDDLNWQDMTAPTAGENAQIFQVSHLIAWSSAYGGDTTNQSLTLGQASATLVSASSLDTMNLTQDLNIFSSDLTVGFAANAMNVDVDGEISLVDGTLDLTAGSVVQGQTLDVAGTCEVHVGDGCQLQLDSVTNIPSSTLFTVSGLFEFGNADFSDLDDIITNIGATLIGTATISTPTDLSDIGAVFHLLADQPGVIIENNSNLSGFANIYVGAIDNHGSITPNDDTILSGLLVNQTGASLTLNENYAQTGPLVNFGTVDVNTAPFVIIENLTTNTGEINFSGPGTVQFQSGQGQIAGTLNLPGGEILVSNGATVFILGGLDHRAGATLTTENGSQLGVMRLVIESDILGTGDISVAEQLVPGFSVPKVIDIGGNLTLEFPTTVPLDIAGDNAGEFDQIQIGGDFNLSNSSLIVDLAPGYELVPGAQYEIFNVGGITTGNFTGLPEGSQFAPFETITIDFEDLSSSGTGTVSIGNSYESDGVLIDTAADENLYYHQTGHPNFAGSTGLANELLFDTNNIEMSNGDDFDLKSIDVSNLANDGPVTIDFVAYLNGIVAGTHSFTTSGTANGFETVEFPESFFDIDRVSWAQQPPFHQFDNVVVRRASEASLTISYTAGDGNDIVLLASSPHVLGDANGDGVFSNLDIASFVLALTNPVAYLAMFPDSDPDVVLDMNGDGVFDNLDIAGFVAALTGP